MPNAATKKTKLAPRRLIIPALIILVGGGILFIRSLHRHGRTVSIDGNHIRVEIARTNAERERGLCCRRSLPADRGMLFMYVQPGDYRYWMKDTLIPLDMIWIDSNKKIIYIKPSVQPSSYPKTFGPLQPAKYVLEVNGGYTHAHAITVGERALF